MKLHLSFQKFDSKNNIHTDAMLKWENDFSINYLFTPVRDRDSKIEKCSLEFLSKKYEKNLNSYTNYHLYLILDGERPIGNLSIHIDPVQLFKKDTKTSWLGLVIGEKDYWGSGAAKLAMEFFENESRRLGAKRIELGVFEFNERAKIFYQKLGYIEIARLNNFTYWKHRYWNDIRMEKDL